jgi:uncharacterized membrane protein
MTKAVCKALTWRIVGTAEVFVISWFTTGTLELAGHIAGFAAVTSTVLYVIHKKLWASPKCHSIAAHRAIDRQR